MRTHYDNLKVPESATGDEIKTSYRRLCLQFHPDRNPGSSEAERIMRIINDAYDVLSDSVKRRAYDQELVLRRARESAPRGSPSSNPSRGAWQPSPGTRRHETQKQERPYYAPEFRTADWRRKSSRSHHSGSGRGNSMATRVVISVAVILVVNVFFRANGPSSVFPTPAGHREVARPYISPRTILPDTGSDAPGPGTSISDADSSKHTRPPTAPNGLAWPESAGYVRGYPVESIAGESRVTLDNTDNSHDVFAKLISLRDGKPYAVRTCFVPAHAAFTLMSVTPGDFDLRFHDLTTGVIRKTEPFLLKEMRGSLGVQYTTLRLGLTSAGCTNMKTGEITEQDF